MTAYFWKGLNNFETEIDRQGSFALEEVSP